MATYSHRSNERRAECKSQKFLVAHAEKPDTYSSSPRHSADRAKLNPEDRVGSETALACGDTCSSAAAERGLKALDDARRKRQQLRQLESRPLYHQVWPSCGCLAKSGRSTRKAGGACHRRLLLTRHLALLAIPLLTLVLIQLLRGQRYVLGLPTNRSAARHNGTDTRPELLSTVPAAATAPDAAGNRPLEAQQRDEQAPALDMMQEYPAAAVGLRVLIIVLLLFLSAVTSGLNLGLMSLDMNELAVISSCGDKRERAYARIIIPLRKRSNFLLCSLLLGNVMVNSTLTVLLEEMTSGFVAIIASTLAIVILGEIVPQAMCARNGLAIGARTIYLTYACMLLTLPLSYPISRLLDCWLGEDKGNVYDRERLMEFIRITGHHTQLGADEVAIISGALKLKQIKVDDIMTKLEDVFMLPIDCKLDRTTIKSIVSKGYSRVPVYEFQDRKQIVALILAKDLALLDPDDPTPVTSMVQYCKHPLIFIEDDATLDVALNLFKTGRSHMAVVRRIHDDGETDKYYEAIGVVTLEDVIEEVLQQEINDETDTLSDNRRKRCRTDAQLSLNLERVLSCPPSS